MEQHFGHFLWREGMTNNVEGARALCTKAFPFKQDCFGGTPALAALDGKMIADIEKGPPRDLLSRMGDVPRRADADALSALLRPSCRTASCPSSPRPRPALQS